VTVAAAHVTTTLVEPKGFPVVPALTGLFPDGTLRGGSVLGVGGPGAAMSLLLGVLAGASNGGSWVAAVGLPALGLEAAAGVGVDLDRLALVPEPGPRWPEVVGALLDSLDVVAVCPTGQCRPADARRLAARTRQRQAVLVVVEPGAQAAAAAVSRRADPRAWPESVDLRLESVSVAWDGLDHGDGTLCRRLVTVRSFGRRSAGREREVRLWVPGPDGRIELARGAAGRALGETAEPVAGETAGPVAAEAAQLESSAAGPVVRRPAVAGEVARLAG
jgi:hypothetical protein